MKFNIVPSPLIIEGIKNGDNSKIDILRKFMSYVSKYSQLYVLSIPKSLLLDIDKRAEPERLEYEKEKITHEYTPKPYMNLSDAIHAKSLHHLDFVGDSCDCQKTDTVFSITEEGKLCSKFDFYKYFIQAYQKQSFPPPFVLSDKDTELSKKPCYEEKCRHACDNHFYFKYSAFKHKEWALFERNNIVRNRQLFKKVRLCDINWKEYLEMFLQILGSEKTNQMYNIEFTEDFIQDVDNTSAQSFAYPVLLSAARAFGFPSARKEKHHEYSIDWHQDSTSVIKKHSLLLGRFDVLESLEDDGIEANTSGSWRAEFVINGSKWFLIAFGTDHDFDHLDLQERIDKLFEQIYGKQREYKSNQKWRFD